MLRKPLIIFLLLIIAVVGPVIFSGYRDLQKATDATSYAEMADHYQKAALRLPWRADLYELAGHAYYQAGKYTLAATAYQKAFDKQALSAEGWVAWGDVFYLQEDRTRATEIWEQALSAPDPSVELFSRLAQIYQADQDYERATKVLTQYANSQPDDARAHYRLGLLLTLSNPEKALSELLTAAQQDVQLDPAVQTMRTAINLALLETKPASRAVLIGRGLALLQEWEFAKILFQQAVQSDPKHAEAMAWLEETHYHLGEPIGYGLDQAVTLAPNSAIVHGLRGLYFQRTSNFRQALTEFDAAIRLEPQNPTWQVSLGETQSKLGDLILALASYQRATTLAPDDPNYWRLLALFCAQNGIHLRDIGVPAAQKAVVLAPKNAIMLDTLGWLLFLDSRPEDAEKQLQRALVADPQNASAHLHLGLVYLQQNASAAAREQLVLARDLGDPEAAAVLTVYFP